jgi:hypothetical protein
VLQEAAAEKRELLFELGVLKEGAGESDLSPRTFIQP